MRGCYQITHRFADPGETLSHAIQLFADKVIKEFEELNIDWVEGETIQLSITVVRDAQPCAAPTSHRKNPAGTGPYRENLDVCS